MTLSTKLTQLSLPINKTKTFQAWRETENILIGGWGSDIPKIAETGEGWCSQAFLGAALPHVRGLKRNQRT